MNIKSGEQQTRICLSCEELLASWVLLMLVNIQVSQTVSCHHKLELPILHHGKTCKAGLWIKSTIEQTTKVSLFKFPIKKVHNSGNLEKTGEIITHDWLKFRKLIYASWIQWNYPCYSTISQTTATLLITLWHDIRTFTIYGIGFQGLVQPIHFAN